MNKYVKICGIPYKIIYREDNMSSDCCGVIDHKKQIITINQEMAKEYRQTIIHEMVHGMLVCIGRNDLSNDEVFVQSLANAVYTSSLSVVMEEKEKVRAKNENKSE